ncbi:hypothetical protein CspeluHIS016_0300370 [Cutaneotrichosporon spelunceum]|uniref:DUF155 domain-containing protein n=1 Tax=Cutaneotrichosporon spelunceum TaxID=1672016 RepID=A0AAD3YBR9_9TREE|nr:hypothetical protein CspeluHIS016_0300370 [Cutaneotrichosporon spelunceum]
MARNPFPANTLPLPYAHVQQAPAPRREPRQPMRTSKINTKLKVLPTQPDTIPEEDSEDNSGNDEEGDEQSGVKIPAGSARRDALNLTRSEKAKLPRVTAYCTAASYDLEGLQTYLGTLPLAYRTHPRLFEAECLYTQYLPPASPNSAVPAHRSPVIQPVQPLMTVPEGDLLNLGKDYWRAHQPGPKRETGFAKRPGGNTRRDRERALDRDRDDVENDSEDDDWEEEDWVPDVFLFEYGTVVIWGMTEKEEKQFLRSLKKFEVERLSGEDIEREELNFYYADYSRIFNDVITLRKGPSSRYHTPCHKLISATIEQTKDIPQKLSETGKIGLPRTEIMKQIGSLFILRININLVGSVLDSPEFFWTFPDLEPLYNACRQYLEIPQRIDLLNARVDVLQDMLNLLKESVNSSQGEHLEAVVILLIALEIILGFLTIYVDVNG